VLTRPRRWSHHDHDDRPARCGPAAGYLHRDAYNIRPLAAGRTAPAPARESRPDKYSRLLAGYLRRYGGRRRHSGEMSAGDGPLGAQASGHSTRIDGGLSWRRLESFSRAPPERLDAAAAAHLLLCLPRQPVARLGTSAAQILSSSSLAPRPPPPPPPAPSHHNHHHLRRHHPRRRPSRLVRTAVCETLERLPVNRSCRVAQELAASGWRSTCRHSWPTETGDGRRLGGRASAKSAKTARPSWWYPAARAARGRPKGGRVFRRVAPARQNINLRAGNEGCGRRVFGGHTTPADIFSRQSCVCVRVGANVLRPNEVGS
jgi:hypothetical protein